MTQHEEASPILLAFLETDDFNKKNDIIIRHMADLDDHLVNQMAASIDAVVEDGPIDSRILSLQRCISTRARYETGRR